jgi:hypothetical protein
MFPHLAAGIAGSLGALSHESAFLFGNESSFDNLVIAAFTAFE